VAVADNEIGGANISGISISMSVVLSMMPVWWLEVPIAVVCNSFTQPVTDLA